MSALGGKRTLEAGRDFVFKQIELFAFKAQRKQALLLGKRRKSFCKFKMDASG